MNIYGKEPQEQALQKLIHDTNSALSYLNNQINGIVEWNKKNSQILKKHNEDLDSEIFIRIEYLKSKRKEIIDAIDRYVRQAKDDFK